MGKDKDKLPVVTLQDVEANRETLAQKKTELRAVDREERGRAEVWGNTEPQLVELRDEGQRDLLKYASVGRVDPRAFLENHIPGMSPSIRVPALVFACFDEIKKNMKAAIFEAFPEDAMTPEQRAEKKARLVAEILKLEEIEERFIRQLIALGMHVDRRPDADPATVLQFKSPTDWDQSTLDDLRGRLNGIRAVIQGHNQTIAPMEQDNRSREASLRGALMRDKAAEERIQKDIDTAKAHITSLRNKIAKLQPKADGYNKLVNMCERFLREHGVRDVA